MESKSQVLSGGVNAPPRLPTRPASQQIRRKPLPSAKPVDEQRQQLPGTTSRPISANITQNQTMSQEASGGRHPIDSSPSSEQKHSDPVCTTKTHQMQAELPSYRDQLPPGRLAEFNQAMRHVWTTCQQLDKDGLFEDAIVLGDAFLQLDPDASYLHLLLADINGDQRNWSKTACHHRHAYDKRREETEPKDLNCWVKCLTLIPNKAAEALAVCEELEWIPVPEEVDLKAEEHLRLRFRLIATVLRLNGRVAEANRCMNFILQFDDANEDEAIEWGKIFFEQDMYDGAIKCLGQEMLFNENACAMYRLGRYEELIASYVRKPAPDFDPRAAKWVAASLLKVDRTHSKSNLDNPEVYARVAMTAESDESDLAETKDILREVLGKSGASNTDWKERFLELLKHEYSTLSKKFYSGAFPFIAYALKHSGVDDPLVYLALDEVEAHEAAVEIKNHVEAQRDVADHINWQAALDRDGSDDDPAAFRAWMSRYFTGFWPEKGSVPSRRPLADVIPLYLVRVAMKTRWRSRRGPRGEYWRACEFTRRDEDIRAASWLLENAFESNPVDDESLWEVLNDGGWNKIERTIRLTGESSTETCEYALSIIMDKHSWGKIKENRLKSLPLRISLTYTKEKDKPKSKHWRFKEELAHLTGDYSQFFWDMNNSSMGPKWALAWLEANQNKVPREEHQRLVKLAHSNIKDAKKLAKRKVKWAKEREKAELVERARGPPAPAWMQERSREMSEQMLKNQLAWRAFNQ